MKGLLRLDGQLDEIKKRRKGDWRRSRPEQATRRRKSRSRQRFCTREEIPSKQAAGGGLAHEL